MLQASKVAGYGKKGSSKAVNSDMTVTVLQLLYGVL